MRLHAVPPVLAQLTLVPALPIGDVAEARTSKDGRDSHRPCNCRARFVAQPPATCPACPLLTGLGSTWWPPQARTGWMRCGSTTEDSTCRAGSCRPHGTTLGRSTVPVACAAGTVLYNSDERAPPPAVAERRPQDMPHRGSLKVRYTSERSAGCRPDIECRELLLRRVRCCGCNPEEPR